MSIVLTLNGGSSSIRFAFYDARDCSRWLLAGKIDRIGLRDTCLSVREFKDGKISQVTSKFDAESHESAVEYLMKWFATQPLFAKVAAVGHRVVHGMQHSNPERVTPELLSELNRITPYDPEHLPGEIRLMQAMTDGHPQLPQVACFDTAFHRTMPRVATILPIPRRYERHGVQRYGFHGLSYTFLMAQLERAAGPTAARGRIILAHLGNGASLAAVHEGRSIDTSMGFTPTSGLVMSSRSGDLDPGVITFLSATEGMNDGALQKMVTHESGLLGVSETSSDIRDLLAREAQDVRAAEAVALFCYQVKKWIGSFAAALGGLETLVFAGGIGENAVAIRTRICAGLEFLGIELNEACNAQSSDVISLGTSRVTVRVIPTDEESVIAGSTIRVLQLTTPKDGDR